MLWRCGLIQFIIKNRLCVFLFLILKNCSFIYDDHHSINFVHVQEPKLFKGTVFHHRKIFIFLFTLLYYNTMLNIILPMLLLCTSVYHRNLEVYHKLRLQVSYKLRLKQWKLLKYRLTHFKVKSFQV